MSANRAGRRVSHSKAGDRTESQATGVNALRDAVGTASGRMVCGGSELRRSPMADTVRGVEYYYVTVPDAPGEASGSSRRSRTAA